jgi:cyclin-dependent kinase 12/13
MFGIGSLASYEFASNDQVGEGTYGYVYRARDKRNGDQVALKRLIFHKESAGFPLCAIREIKFLKSLTHKNIVHLKGIVTSKGCEHLDPNVSKKSLKSEQQAPLAAEGDDQNNKNEAVDTNRVIQLCGNMYLVFEYVDHDLGGLVDSKYKFSQKSIKCIIKQLFEALDYLSEKKVIHRDIKTSNLLLSNRHQLKLADFGLARSSLSIDGREGKVDLTNNVVRPCTVMFIFLKN